MNCPKCGAHIPMYNLKPNCYNCGVNIMYFTQETELSKDAKRAELEFAVARIIGAKLKKTFIGGKIYIARLVMLVAIICMLLPPFAVYKLTVPNYTAQLNVSGLGAYNLFSQGLLMKLPSIMDSSVFGSATIGAVVTYALFVITVLLGVAVFACLILSFIDIKKISEVMSVLSFVAAGTSLATAVAALGAKLAFMSVTVVSVNPGFGAFLAAAVFVVNGLINRKISKSEIEIKYRENDLLRRETLKKIKSGEISFDDLTLPVYETPEEKEERLKALAEALKNEEEGKE